MLQSLLTNWKTTLAAVLLIANAAAHMVDPTIPGQDLGTALSAALGLLFASDAATTKS